VRPGASARFRYSPRGRSPLRGRDVPCEVGPGRGQPPGRPEP
jgi:hypothetical protein